YQVARLRNPSERNLLGIYGSRIGVFQILRVHSCAHKPWHDSVHVDVEPSPFHGEGLRERNDSCLASVIRRVKWQAYEAAAGCQVDDPSIPLSHHQATKRLRAVK